MNDILREKALEIRKVLITYLLYFPVYMETIEYGSIHKYIITLSEAVISEISGFPIQRMVADGIGLKHQDIPIDNIRAYIKEEAVSGITINYPENSAVSFYSMVIRSGSTVGWENEEQPIWTNFRVQDISFFFVLCDDCIDEPENWKMGPDGLMVDLQWDSRPVGSRSIK